MTRRVSFASSLNRESSRFLLDQDKFRSLIKVSSFFLKKERGLKRSSRKPSEISVTRHVMGGARKRAHVSVTARKISIRKYLGTGQRKLKAAGHAAPSRLRRHGAGVGARARLGAPGAARLLSSLRGRHRRRCFLRFVRPGRARRRAQRSPPPFSVAFCRTVAVPLSR